MRAARSGLSAPTWHTLRARRLELTIQKKWADGAYTDNRVPVTLNIYRKIDNDAGELWKSIALDDSKKLSYDASIWQATESAETHDATNNPYI